MLSCSLNPKFALERPWERRCLGAEHGQGEFTTRACRWWMGWKLGHQHQSTFSWHQVLVKMFPCRFALLHRNTPSRGFLEAGAWLVIFQPSVCYNCSLLFRVLASIKILAEGRVGIGGSRRVTTCFSWQQCCVFLLQGIVELGCK